jgi:hypothetical protein
VATAVDVLEDQVDTGTLMCWVQWATVVHSIVGLCCLLCFLGACMLHRASVDMVVHTDHMAYTGHMVRTGHTAYADQMAYAEGLE